MDNVIVIAAHPDDEVLGCGGAIVHHKTIGDHVTVFFLSDGESSRNCGELQAKQRRKMAERAGDLLGIDRIDFLGFEDQKLDILGQLAVAKSLENAIEAMEFQIVYCHSQHDLNSDHRCAFDATMVTFRPTPDCTVKEIRSFEVPSSTGWGAQSGCFKPNLFVDVSELYQKKLDALFCYDKEMRETPHARSYESVINLMRYRGSVVGLEYAEAFEIQRAITR